MTKQLTEEATIRSLIHEEILKCKDECYAPNGRNASNELGGDYGTWQDWEDKIVAIITSQSKLAVEGVLDKIQEVLNMQEKVMLEHNGRPDCKNCSLAETLDEIIQAERNLPTPPRKEEDIA